MILETNRSEVSREFIAAFFIWLPCRSFVKAMQISSVIDEIKRKTPG